MTCLWDALQQWHHGRLVPEDGRGIHTRRAVPGSIDTGKTGLRYESLWIANKLNPFKAEWMKALRGEEDAGGEEAKLVVEDERDISGELKEIKQC